MVNDTIAAIATPAGNGGIGIIKISGKNAISITTSIFKRSSEKVRNTSTDVPTQHKYSVLIAEEIKSHRLYYGYIIDPKNEKPIDEVLMSVMKAPHSYTKEDIVEINVHSGRVILRTILDLVLSNGARLADPGEFTKRAFLNGRIDLTQAEAVMDLINAKNRKALEVANVQAGGELYLYIQKIIKALTDILVEIEASIDFPDEIGSLDLKTMNYTIGKEIIQTLKSLIEGYDQGHVLREGLKVVIVGRPNVGKSSLMNQLLKKDHAIVTSVPGTTRDILEETLIVSGIHTIITDTAGLCESNDPVETIGIKKTREKIKEADLVLFMVDAVAPFIKSDFEIYENIKGKSVILVINKIDLSSEDNGVETTDEFKMLPVVKISALYNIGINSLKEMIKEIFNKKTDYYSNDIIPNIRQKIALENSIKSIYMFLNGLQSGLPLEMISIDLKEAIEFLKEAVGLKINEDVLDHIFSRFCIGK